MIKYQICLVKKRSCHKDAKRFSLLQLAHATIFNHMEPQVSNHKKNVSKYILLWFVFLQNYCNTSIKITIHNNVSLSQVGLHFLVLRVILWKLKLKPCVDLQSSWPSALSLRRLFSTQYILSLCAALKCYLLYRSQAGIHNIPIENGYFDDFIGFNLQDFSKWFNSD